MPTLDARLAALAASGRLVGFEPSSPAAAAASPPAPAAVPPSPAEPADPSDPFGFGPLPSLATADARLAALEARPIEARQRLIDAGWNETGMREVDRVARAQGIDHATAAAIVEANNPQPDLAASTGAWPMLYAAAPSSDAVNLDDLIMNDDGEAFLRKAIPVALNDVRKRR